MKAHAKLSALLFVLAASPLHAAEPSNAEARRLYLTGSYAEASEIYSRLADKEPVVAGIGRARCLEALGKDDEALDLLKEVAKDRAPAEVRAEIALLAMERGNFEGAHVMAKAATASTEDAVVSAQAKWILGEVRRQQGRLDDAQWYYKSLVDLYNAQNEIKDADALRYIGLGAAQYARWNRLSDQFHFLVNELYPEIIKLDSNYWPAHYEAGLLYLEKFNEPEAAREFKAALAINPNAAEVHAAVAALALQNYELTDAQKSIKRALEINPRLLWAHQLQADIQLANFEPADAALTLRLAQKLNPLNEQTLGRLAAAYIGLDGLPADGKLRGTRLGRVIDEVSARNRHSGEFFESLADSLDQLRRYPDAVRFYREAICRMPQLVGPRGKLGLIYMRLGNEIEADKLLRESFDIDPFNVRVSNTLKVLEVLAGYATLETEHFVIKFDRAHDELLAQYAAKYLEDDVYPQLVKKFGYAPEGKSLFEIFSRAKNTDGHGWFSARMVGLPYIGTVGACAGRMVAMQSPNDARQKFNWARVLRHEFVHVVNLQQTHFNIPHWFTEALAVQNEGFPRPPQWSDLLKERVTKAKLYNLDTINTGFIRPKSSDDWALAYCQAELYAEYMLDRFGGDALAKMLAGYADNLNTRSAIHQSFDIDQADFERGYVEYLKKVVAGAGQGGAGREGVKALKADARMALESHDDAKLFTALERLAALDADDLVMPKKLAQLSLKKKDFTAAAHWAKQCLDIDVQDAEVHRMLADALEGGKEFAEAAKERVITAKLER